MLSLLIQPKVIQLSGGHCRSKSSIMKVLVHSFRKFYDELKSKGLIAELSIDIEGRKPSEPGTVDFVMPKGSSSIVKHFFHKSGLEVQFNHFVENIKLSDNKWAVTTKVHILHEKVIGSLIFHFVLSQ